MSIVAHLRNILRPYFGQFIMVTFFGLYVLTDFYSRAVSRSSEGFKEYLFYLVISYGNRSAQESDELYTIFASLKINETTFCRQVLVDTIKYLFNVSCSIKIYTFYPHLWRQIKNWNSIHRNFSIGTISFKLATHS